MLMLGIIEGFVTLLRRMFARMISTMEMLTMVSMVFVADRPSCDVTLMQMRVRTVVRMVVRMQSQHIEPSVSQQGNEPICTQKND